MNPPNQQEHDTLVARNQAAVEEMSRVNAHSNKSNRTYDSIEKRFKQFVDGYENGRGLFLLQPGEYMSEHSINSYLLEKEQLRVVQKNSVQKTIYALDHMVKKEGKLYLFGDLPGSKTIANGPCSNTITETLNTVRNSYERKVKEAEECPQNNLPTNIIKEREQSDVLMQLLSKSNQFWGDTASTWATASSTLMRFDSAKRVTLNKLIVLKDLPPHGIETPHDTQSWDSVQSHVDGRIIGMVIPPLEQLKKNQKIENLRPEVVGCYRHKRHERCYQGIISFRIFELLNSGTLISFCAKDHVPEGYTHWSTIKLFHYKYAAANKSFKQAMDVAKVKRWIKVTHMR